jgi:hypothetical protein
LLDVRKLKVSVIYLQKSTSFSTFWGRSQSQRSLHPFRKFLLLYHSVALFAIPNFSLGRTKYWVPFLRYRLAADSTKRAEKLDQQRKEIEALAKRNRTESASENKNFTVGDTK